MTHQGGNFDEAETNIASLMGRRFWGYTYFYQYFVPTGQFTMRQELSLKPIGGMNIPASEKP
jgi:hypothetical protein